MKTLYKKILLLGKPPESGSARLGHIPSLPWESQLPLKPYLSLQPPDFEGNCDSSDSLLDFCFSFIVQFHLLRKCGLLAHTSPTFLKNCWIKKLLFRLRLVSLQTTVSKIPVFWNFLAKKQHFSLKIWKNEQKYAPILCTMWVYTAEKVCYNRSKLEIYALQTVGCSVCTQPLKWRRRFS